MKKAAAICVPLEVAAKFIEDKEYTARLNKCETMNDARKVIREFCKKRA